ALAGVARAAAPVAARVRSSRRDIVLIATSFEAGEAAPHAFGVSRSTRGGASQALTDGQSSPSRVDRKLTDGFVRPGFAECGARGTVHHRPGGWRTVMTSIRPRGPIQPDMTQPVRLTTIA